MKKVIKIDKEYTYSKHADNILITINIVEEGKTSKESLEKYEQKLKTLKDILLKNNAKSICMSFIKYKRLLNNEEKWICTGKHQIITDKFIEDLNIIDNLEINREYNLKNLYEPIEFYKELILNDINAELKKIGAEKYKIKAFNHSAPKIIDNHTDKILLSTCIMLELICKI